jgi:hypothetical protein
VDNISCENPNNYYHGHWVFGTLVQGIQNNIVIYPSLLYPNQVIKKHNITNEHYTGIPAVSPNSRKGPPRNQPPFGSSRTSQRASLNTWLAWDRTGVFQSSCGRYLPRYDAWRCCPGRGRRHVLMSHTLDHTPSHPAESISTSSRPLPPGIQPHCHFPIQQSVSA